MSTHSLKTWPQYFRSIKSGEKNFEVRKNDRNYQVGDTLELREFQANIGFSDRKEQRAITYVLDGGQFGIEPGFVVLGLAKPVENRAAGEWIGPELKCRVALAEAQALVDKLLKAVSDGDDLLLQASANIQEHISHGDELERKLAAAQARIAELEVYAHWSTHAAGYKAREKENEKTIVRLTGELDACEQHGKIKQERIDELTKSHDEVFAGIGRLQRDELRHRVAVLEKARDNFEQLYTGEAQLHAELKTQVDGWKDQTRMLRAALVSLVGSDSRDELEGMKRWLNNSPAGKETVAAIQAILDTEAPK